MSSSFDSDKHPSDPKFAKRADIVAELSDLATELTHLMIGFIANQTHQCTRKNPPLRKRALEHARKLAH